MKRLNDSTLQVGDIILTTTTAKVSKTIRVATKSDVSHAMVYVEKHSVIDATTEGVQARNTQRLIFGDECAVHALRLRGGLSAADVQAICNFARGQVGTQYSAKEAVRTAMWGTPRTKTRKQFCSRLAAQAYASVGIQLVDDPDYCTPVELKNSVLLREVEAVTVPVTAEEAAAWERHPDKPQMMRDTINAVLEGARRKNKQIQNFDDLHAHLAHYPEDDAYMCDILEQSGYLTLWRVEQVTNPWQYDLALMEAASRSIEMADYCRDVLANEMGGPTRYIVNRGSYTAFSKQFGLRFFELMSELYTILATLHHRRVEVATHWLQAHGLQPLTAAPGVLQPHTPAWFEALTLWDPMQAEMARAAIAAAGHVDVCSVCGDDPARDYRLAEANRPPAGVDTLRLCDDCLAIRQTMGEPYEPFDPERSGAEGLMNRSDFR
ncbi:MAG: hypothetical protein HZC22_03515 [Rhodocyclales bacterium]|nr:hypothetical protein [Rhodocyclales bacterium]